MSCSSRSARSAIFGERLLLPQERGDRVELIVFGDEFYARYETLSGHTAVYDAARRGRRRPRSS